MKKYLLLILFQAFVLSILCQQTEINFEHLSVQQGLADHQTNCIIQDHKGFIWIAGGNGLYRHNGYDFTVFKDHGNISTIIEDDLGLLWLCSSKGIELFDPEKERSLLVYSYLWDAAHGDVLLNYRMLQDSRGNIWASCQKGLVKLSYKENVKIPVDKETIFKSGAKSIFNIEVIQLSSHIYKPDNSVWSLIEDDQGNIWAGCEDGLYVLRKGDQSFVRLDQGANKGTQQAIKNIWALLQIDENSYWIAAAKGLYLLTDVKTAFRDSIPDISWLHSSLQPMIGGQLIYSLIKDRNKNFLLGAEQEIYLIKRNAKTGAVTFEQVSHSQAEPEWAGYGTTVRAIFEDRSGILWTAQDYYGVSKFNMNQSQFITYKDLIFNYFSSIDINSVYKDKQGNLWIGTYGGGLYKILQGNNKVIRYDPGTYKSFMISMQESYPGLLWIGSSAGILEFNSNSGKFRDPLPDTKIADNLRSTMIWDMLKDGNQMYIAAYNGLYVYNYFNKELYQFPNSSSTSGDISNLVMALIKMKNGEIWASAVNYGINRIDFNSRNGSLSLKSVYTDKVLNDNGIDIGYRHRLYEDSKGFLWVANYSGIHRINQKTGEVKNYRLFENIEFPEVWSITEDDHDNLWLGTHSGLCRFNMTTGKVKVFEKYDGVPILVHGINSVFKDKGGRMYFGGLGGFYSFNPDSLKTNDSIPPIVITDFRLFNQSVKIDTTSSAILTKNIAYTRSIELRYNQNDLAFEFAALDYNQPSKNKYAYKLEGYQDEWIQTDANNRLATYTNLDPGTYTFRVKGSNNDDIWNEEGTFINIMIHPPFWKTKLAFIVYVVIFLLFLRGYIYWRTRLLKKEKIELEKQVSERTYQIGQQKEELNQQKEELQSTLENLKGTQEQLIESEKMAAIGGLVAGVAHEINTPVGVGITAISNLLDDIQKMAEQFEKDEISRKDFREFLQSSHDVAQLIQKNLERTASLVQSFKQVSTDQVTEQQRVFAFREYLNDILLSLKPKFREKKINFSIACDEELKLNSYPGVYALIFTNLLLNSFQHGFYQRETGKISIKAELKKVWLIITYRDDGAGINTKDLPHIFEPFYTSDQHRGTGLGLNIVYNLVKQKLHGTITCESESGKGVLFTIEVPV